MGRTNEGGERSSFAGPSSLARVVVALGRQPASERPTFLRPLVRPLGALKNFVAPSHLEREPKGLPRGRLDLVQRGDLHLLEADLEEGRRRVSPRGPEGAALLPVDGGEHDEEVDVLLPHHLPEGGARRLQRVLRQDELAPVEEACNE